MAASLIGLSIFDIYNSVIECKKLDLVSFEFLGNYYEEKIEPKPNFGAVYYPEKFYYWFGKYWELDDKMVFAFDLTDLMNLDEPFVSTVLKRDRIWVPNINSARFVVRAGISSDYPTLGVGLIPNANIEHAVYMDEKGIYQTENLSDITNKV